MYRHSNAFHDLKHTKESITGNLTSAQYLQTLDYLLWRALGPIVRECPTFFNNYITKIIAYQALKPSVKYSSEDKDSLPTMFLKFLMTQKEEDAKAMYLNRGVYFGLLSEFEKATQPTLYPSKGSCQGAYYEVTRVRTIQELGFKNQDTAYVNILEVMYWHRLAVEFKQLIVQKYTRTAINQARATYVDFNHKVPLDDVVQTYMIVLNKAIDRCDSRLGVLTTYINTWLKTARGMIKTECEARAQSLDTLIEENPTLEVLGSEDFDGTYEALQHVAYVASQVDTLGAVKTLLGIPQYVPMEHVKLLREYVND